MTSWILRRGLLAAVVPSFAANAQERSITVASTTSTEQSGLFGHILPLFTRETGVSVRVVALGTGQARRLAGEVLFLHRGRLLEHAPAAEFFAGPRAPEAAAFLRGDLVW